METATTIASILGPTLMVVTASETLNAQIWARNTAAGVHLNGLFLFVVGLAIVRFHPHLRADWTAAVTISGALLLVAGTLRMVFPTVPTTFGKGTHAIAALVFGLGGFLTWHGYS